MKIVGMLLFSLAFLSVIASTHLYLKYIWQKNTRSLELGHLTHKILFGITAVIGILLFYSILSHDFSIGYVANYSSTREEWYYLFSTFWAGQEGTFYLWLIYTIIFGLVVIKQNNEFTPYVMVILNITNFFLILILLKQSPFRPLDPEIFANLIDGRGLNPLLKNPWMVIHPPTLFLGYSSVVVTASYAIAGLWSKKTAEWITPAFPWALFTTAILGLGVMMGGYWAYIILGWGGYWAWDPVENASIFPWFLMIACFHSMLIYKSVKGFLKTAIWLAIAAYFLMLYGSFLTRSGVLANFSVHSFSSLGLNTYLISFIVFYVLIAVYFYLKARKEIVSSALIDAFNKETIMAFVVIIFTLSTFAIVIGTSIPLFTLLGEKQQASAQPELYNQVFSHIAIIVLIFLGLAPVLKWKNAGFQLSKIITIITITVALSFGLVVYISKPSMPIHYYIVFASTIWAFIINIYNLIRFSKSPVLRNSSLTHVGLALMFLGIMTSSTLGENNRLLLIKNEVLKYDNLNLEFAEKYTDKVDPNSTNYTVKVTDTLTTPKFDATLVFTYTDFNKGMMRHPYINQSLSGDTYFSPVNQYEYPQGLRTVLGKGESLKNSSIAFRFDEFNDLEMNPQESIFRVKANFTYGDSAKKVSSVFEQARGYRKI